MSQSRLHLLFHPPPSTRQALLPVHLIDHWQLCKEHCCCLALANNLILGALQWPKIKDDLDLDAFIAMNRYVHYFVGWNGPRGSGPNQCKKIVSFKVLIPFFH
jgi:hypothetical protein